MTSSKTTECTGSHQVRELGLRSTGDFRPRAILHRVEFTDAGPQGSVRGL